MNWNDITLDKWEKLHPYLTQGGDVPEDEKVVNAIAIIYDMTVDEVLNLPLMKFNELSKSLGFLTEYPEYNTPDMKMMINNHPYDVVANFHKLTAAQYIDWDRNCNGKEGDAQYYRQALCILLIPRGHKYNDGYDMLDVWNDVGMLNMSQVLSLSAFFLVIYKSYCRALLLYSARTMRKKGKPGKEIAKDLEKMADMYGLPSWTA